MSDNCDENVFFSLDEDKDDESTDNNDNSDNNFLNLLDDFDNQTNGLTHEEIIESMSIEYKLKYNVKELLLICDYYGIGKELKNNKCCKEIIIMHLVDFENILSNNEIVTKRRELWRYINILKNDKFMKKYVIW
jgi:hypothetical protein